MSIARTVSAAVAAGALAGFAGFVAGKRVANADRIVMTATPPNPDRVALVRERPCGDGGRCQSLWIGPTTDDATEVMKMTGGDKVEEIAWSADGTLVGFVVNGYQLRVFDPATKNARATVELFKPDRIPSSRIARGVTFSANGFAVTYDDCPRTTSGCRSARSAER